LLIVGVLVGGLYLAVVSPFGSTIVLRRAGTGPRSAPNLPTLTVVPGSGGSPIAVLTITPRPVPTPTATAEAPSPTMTAEAPNPTATAAGASPTAAATRSTPGPTRAPTGTITPGPRVTGTTPAATSTPPPGSRVYTVQSGDTLFALALRYSSSVEAIMRANDIPERSTPLRVGQRLVIPPP
jgi:LysM repeat protein